jgi:hypothetical protein
MRHTVISVAVAATTSLDLVVVLHGASYNIRNLIGALRVCNSSRNNWNVQIVDGG